MSRVKLPDDKKGERKNVFFPPGRMDKIMRAARKKKMNFSKYINWVLDNWNKK